MSDNSSRPEPEYGAYATPEEQRRRMGLPPEEPNAPTDVHASAPGAPVAPRSPSQAPQAAQPGHAAHGAPRPEPVGFNWNRAFTFLFLGVGAYVVITNLPGMFNLYGSFIQVAEILTPGVEPILDNSIGLRLIGLAAAAVYIVGWVFGLWLSLRRLRATKSSWWIPLVVGLVVNFVVFALLTIALTSQGEFVTQLMTNMSDLSEIVPSQSPTP
ncbi:MAG: DUF6264 family protein [Mycetocola sp.]